MKKGDRLQFYYKFIQYIGIEKQNITISVSNKNELNLYIHFWL